MLGLETIPFAVFVVKHIILLLIGIKIFTLLTDLLTNMTGEEFISQIISVAIAILIVYLLRETFIAVVLLVLILSYAFGSITKVYRWLKI